MSLETCQICSKDSTPWKYIDGHICADCSMPDEMIYRVTLEDFLALCWAHEIAVTIKACTDGAGYVFITVDNKVFKNRVATTFFVPVGIGAGLSNLWEIIKKETLKEAS